MKTIIEFSVAVAFTAVLVSCSVKEADEIPVIPSHDVFYASVEPFEDAQTRVYADESYHIRWNAGDLISIFNFNTFNQEYRFDGADGANSGSFSLVNTGSFYTGNEVPTIYAVYPYNAATQLSDTQVLSVQFPATQTYDANTFGLGANLMVSAGTSNKLLFKNAGGVLVLKVFGSGAVASVTLSGNNGEKLSGPGSISMPASGLPTVTMAQSANTSLTLTCPEPVELGPDEDHYTEFWLVLPPVTFSSGFTVTLYGPGGTSATKSTVKSIPITRSSISRMAPFEANLDYGGLQPDNEIWYTTTDGKPLNFNCVVDPTVFYGADLVSNLYHNGKGVLKFDGPVVRIGDRSIYMSTQDPFYHISNLKTLSLPNSVRMICFCAFANCPNLSSIVLPDHLDYCGGSIVSSSSLEQFNMPETDYWSNGNPVSGCSKLKRFTGPYASADGRMLVDKGEIRSFAPAGLPSYVIPEGIVSVGLWAFSGSRNLDGIIFPTTITTIKTQAFASCSALKDLVLPASLQNVGDYAFAGCTGLLKVTVPIGVSLGESVFHNCTSIVSFFGPYASSDGRLLVSSTGETLAFAPGGLTEYTVPDGIVSIRDGFNFDHYYYLKLETLRLPSSVESAELTIGSLRTLVCNSLTPPLISSQKQLDLPNIESIYVPEESVDAYKSATYWNAYQNKIKPIPVVQPDNEIWYTSKNNIVVTPYASDVFGSVIVSNTNDNGKGIIKFDGPVTAVGKRAFYCISAIKSVLLPSSVVSIGDAAFEKSGLEEIVIPDNVSSINDGCFGLCTRLHSFSGKYASQDGRYLSNNGILFAFASSGLTTYTIPSSITAIAREAFYGCTSLESIVIPNSVTSIGGYAFLDCSSLTSVNIPSSVSSFGDGPFCGCDNLSAFYGQYSSSDHRLLVKDGKVINFASSGLSSYSIPEGITCLGWGSLIHNKLSQLTLPQSLLTIDPGALSDMQNIESLVVPCNVNSIGHNAFYDNKKLNSVSFMSVVPPKGGSSMLDYTNDCPIYVPSESVEAYKSAPYWSVYASRIKPIIESVDMGLSVKWATYNLGADKPSGTGGFYAWADVNPGGSFSRIGYKWADELGAYTKYYAGQWASGEGLMDPSDDAARALWGNGWRIPTKEEIQELCNPSNCKFDHVEIDGVKGLKFTSKITGNSIFLPACGYRSDREAYHPKNGYYWSSTISNQTTSPYSLLFNTIDVPDVTNMSCYQGLQIRPVHD